MTCEICVVVLELLACTFHVLDFRCGVCALRLLPLEICVLYAKRRCMSPFFCAVNMSSVKIVSLNGNARAFLPLPSSYSFCFMISTFRVSCGISFVTFFRVMAGLRGSAPAHCAGHWWSQQTSGHSATVRQASFSSFSRPQTASREPRLLCAVQIRKQML